MFVSFCHDENEVGRFITVMNNIRGTQDWEIFHIHYQTADITETSTGADGSQCYFSLLLKYLIISLLTKFFQQKGDKLIVVTITRNVTINRSYNATPGWRDDSRR